jgi:hypothetical protein
LEESSDPADFDTVEAAHAKAQQLANHHSREVVVKSLRNGRFRADALGDIDPRHKSARTEYTVSPTVHSDGSAIAPEHVVEFGDVKPGERFRFFQSTPINTKVGKAAYTAPNTEEGKLMYHQTHKTVQRIP